MICIAAFIILAIAGIFVAFISIFKPKVGKKYLKMLKKSWSCFGKRITLQKCETGFGDEVKNTILSRVVLRRPKLVKPLSVSIEIASILIVLITAWSLIEGIKAGLALWTLGTCNVKHASACSLGAEVCSIDDNSEPENVFDIVSYWFSDWGEILGAIPDKFRNWDVENFPLHSIVVKTAKLTDDIPHKRAIDIFDPGCEVCLISFRAQLESGFFDETEVYLVPFPIQDEAGKLKFKNSMIISQYLLAANQYHLTRQEKSDTAFQIIKRIYTEKDSQNRNWQAVFNDIYTNDETEQALLAWLREFGETDGAIIDITKLAKSEQIATRIAENNKIVVSDIHAKGIPTMIYDGRKHNGRYEAKQ